MGNQYDKAIRDASGMPEDAKPIPGFDGYYATRCGELWSTRRSSNGRRLKTCTTTTTGYEATAVSIDGVKKFLAVHRAVLLAHVGPPSSERPLALHWDGDMYNNRLENLRWGSHFENVADAYRHGTRTRDADHAGSNNPNSKLTEVIVLAIRNSPETITILANRYGVSSNAIWEARTGKTWKHVGGLDA